MIKKMVYTSVLAALIGTTVFSIDLGFFQLSLFRIIILFILYIMLIQVILRDGKIALATQNENRYSLTFFLVWVMYAIVTLAWVKDYNSWVRTVYFLALGLICIIVYSKFFKTTENILTAFYMFSIMIIVHNIIGWYEIITGRYMFLVEERVARYALFRQPVSIFHNTNDFATFMLFSIFIAYICAVNSTKIIGKMVFVGTMISSGLLLFATFSRANILGLIMAFFTFVCLTIKNRRGRYYLLIGLVMLFVFILFKPDIIFNIGLSISQNLKFDFTSSMGSAYIRMNLIRNGFSFLIKTFGFGTGAGNIEYWMANYAPYYTAEVLNMHNWWMEILTSYGVIIFSLYVIFYLKLLRSLYKTYKLAKNKKSISISVGIICCMVGYIIGSISSSTNMTSEWLWCFWGISVAFQGIGLRNQKAEVNH